MPKNKAAHTNAHEQGCTHKCPRQGCAHTNAQEQGCTHKCPRTRLRTQMPKTRLHTQMPKNKAAHTNAQEQGCTRKCPKQGCAHKCPKQGCTHECPKQGCTRKCPRTRLRAQMFQKHAHNSIEVFFGRASVQPGGYVNAGTCQEPIYIRPCEIIHLF